MSDPFWDNFGAKKKGQVDQQAALATGPSAAGPSPYAENSYIGGAIASAFSGLTELFGAEPGPRAEAFRAENPIAGVVTSLAGMAVPYVGWEQTALKLPQAVGITERALAAIPGVRKLSAVETPIRYGAAKLAVQFSPVELARLGVGPAIAQDWDDYGNLLADVGLSVALTGGFGAAGGFFRQLGTRAPAVGRAVGADLHFQPTFEYRMARERERAGLPVSTGDLPDADFLNEVRTQVFTQRADEMAGPLKYKYVEGLEGGTPEEGSWMNGLFKPSPRADQRFLQKKPFMDNRTGLWNFDEAELQRISSSAGFKDIDELGETVVQPRVVTVQSDAAAGHLGSILDRAQGMKWMGEEGLLGREPNSGLFVFAKRTKAGAVVKDELDEAADALLGAAKSLDPEVKTFTPLKIAKGDEWLIGMTDNPAPLFPEAAKVADMNMSRWAKWRSAFKPSKSPDPFNQRTNLLLDAVTPKDWSDWKSTSKNAMLGRLNKRITQRLLNETGLEGSAQGHALAENLYNLIAPAIHLEGKNPLYQRLYTILRGTISQADELTNTLMYGKTILGKAKGGFFNARNKQFGEGFAGNKSAQELINKLDTQEERNLFASIANSQLPAERWAEVSAAGGVSQAVTDAVEGLMKLNRDVWDQVLMPAFQATDLGGEFKLLEGYIMPRIFRGDFFVPVEDHAGNTVWLASGKKAVQAQKEAQTIIDEAGKAGMQLRMGQHRASHLATTSTSEISKISDLIQEQMARSQPMQDVIAKALKKVEVERIGLQKQRGLRRAPTPESLMKERTGVAGSPDVQDYSKKDLLEALDSHYRQLLKFAGHHTWRSRFLPEARSLERLDPTMAAELDRKSQQLMGISGEITKVLDNTLSKVFGGALGNKAATKIAHETNRLLANWNVIILNPVQAMLNLLNPLQTVAPHIAFMLSHAPTEAKERLMLNELRFDREGRVAGHYGVLHPIKVLWQAMKEMGNPDEALRAAYGRGVTDATLTPQQYEGFVGTQAKAHQTFREAFHEAGGGVEGGWELIKRMSTYMFDKTEELSRVNAFTSGWILGRDVFGLSDEALYQFAKRTVQTTMYGYSVVDRSRLFTGPIGSMFGLFKNWQMHFIGSMASYANLGIKEGVWSPMIWQGSVALAVGGLGATPLKMLADGLSKWEDKDNTGYLWMQEHWGPDAADHIMFGLPSFLGASLQASSAIPGTDVRNDLSHLMGFVAWERGKALGAAVGQAWDYAEVNNTNPFTDPNIRDQVMAATMPRAVFKAMSTTEGDYIRSMKTGYPQVRDVPWKAQVLQGLGFTPVEVERQLVTQRELYKQQEAKRTVLQNLGERYAQALVVGDRDEMTDVMLRARLYGVNPQSVIRSANTRARRELQSDNLSSFDKALVERRKRAFGEE